MHRTILIAAIALTVWFPLLCIRVTMAANDVPLSYEGVKWGMIEFVFHGLALALLWGKIISGG